MPIGSPCSAGSDVAAGDGGVGGLGGGAGAVEIAGDHGVDGVVDGFDAGDAAFQEFGGGELLGADQAAGFDGGQVTGFGHWLGPGRWSGGSVATGGDFVGRGALGLTRHDKTWVAAGLFVTVMAGRVLAICARTVRGGWPGHARP